MNLKLTSLCHLGMLALAALLACLNVFSVKSHK